VAVAVATGGWAVMAALTSGTAVALLSIVGVRLGVLVAFALPLTSAG
jgi:hypothetical protein